MSKIKFSLITSAILVLSSFIPILQVLILTVNGAFVSIFTSSDDKTILLVNGIASLLMFGLFYFSNNTITKLLSVLGVLLFFFIPLLFYATENIISTEKYYFLQFLIIGIITGVTLLIIEIIKTKRPSH